MIPLACRSERVLLDTSPFMNFAEAGLLLPLASHLGERAAVTLDVQAEIDRNAAGRFPDLKMLGMLRWPPGEPLALPPDLLADADALRRVQSPEHAHPDENRGEIATALMAGHLRDCVVIMDDALGKQLCRMRGLARLSSAQLAAEMVAAGAVDRIEGLRAFEVATPQGVGEPEFEEALGKATAALNSS